MTDESRTRVDRTTIGLALSLYLVSFVLPSVVLPGGPGDDAIPGWSAF